MKNLFSAIIVTVCLWLCESSVTDRVTIEQMSKGMSFQTFGGSCKSADVTLKPLIYGIEKGTVVNT